MTNLFDKFRLGNEKEALQNVIDNIDNSVVFRGTNLWVLICAIFIASLGLNINSTAVIIGAMLISPLMGPIMGIGLGMGIGDIAMLRKSAHNYLIATIVALATSTLFFLLSPLSQAHSEILARTSPTIYDVLIALFGGFAGIIATSSKQKGNVIPGVAIATALMPPLCTAGYGMATFQLQYFVGAFYLYIINTVFIAWATLIIVRILHFPYKQLANKQADRIAQRIVWLIVIATLIPSLYFGYDIVKQEKFLKKANAFVTNEAHFQNDYLLNKKIDPKTQTISLVFGGKEITDKDMDGLRSELKKYGLEGAILEIKQGFAYLSEQSQSEKNERVEQLTKALTEQEELKKAFQKSVDSVRNHEMLAAQLFQELKAQYPFVREAIIQPSHILSDSAVTKTTIIVLNLALKMRTEERAKLQEWLKVRLHQENIKLILQ
jgi:uncharacterized hydrophobic protein (TIGR00271 family)